MMVKHARERGQKHGPAASAVARAFLLLFIPIAAQGSPVFMGNIESIYPDSLTNALRSPALIPAQSRDIETGLTMKYKAYHKSTASIDSDFTFLDNEALNMKSQKNSGATAYYSFTFRSGDTGFGLGITTSDDDQFMQSTDRVILTGNLSGLPTAVRSETTEKKSSRNPAISLSLGTRTGDSSYAGFKVISGSSKSETRSEEKFSQDSVLSSIASSKTRHEIYSLELQFGFYTREGDSQAGLVIKSGSVEKKKSSIEYQEELAGTPSERISIPSYIQRKKGPSIVAGGYTKLLPFLGVALEGEYRMPAYYYDKTLDKASDGKYYEEKMRKYPLPEYHARGGLEFILSQSIHFLMGGGFIYSGYYGIDRNPDGTRRKEEKFEYRVYYGETGISIRLTEGTSFNLGGVYTKFRVKARMDSDMHMDIRQDLTQANTFLGFSLSF